MTDLILTGGDIRTMDPKTPRVEALAVSHGRVAALGGEKEIRRLAGPGTQKIELGGRLVLPGFTDGHIHFYDWSLSLMNLPLGQARDRRDLLAMLAEKAASSETGQWLSGRGLDESAWPEPWLPSLAELDSAAPVNPVILFRRDMHMALVNSRALELAGIGHGTPDPPEGVIGRDSEGRPDGILRERAMNLALAVIPEPTEFELAEAMAGAQAILHTLGVTGVHDMRIMGGVCGAPSFNAWQRLDRAGRLRLRAWMCLSGDHQGEAARLGLRTGFGNDRLKVGHLKFFSDGSVGARTAWMFEPYLDGGTGCGMAMTPADDLARAITKAEADGMSVAIHAIGTRALDALLGAFEEAARLRGSDCPLPAAPHRIEHVQMLRPEDLPRLARLNLVASVQPMHIVDDFEVMDQAVGTGGVNAYRFRQMLDENVTLSLGSDAPVSDPNPLCGIHAAVTRQRPGGAPKGGWYPEQRISVEEAVWGYTMGTAVSSGRADELGSLTPGKFADMVVLDRDIFGIEPWDIPNAKVEMTFFQGVLVHKS